MQIVMMGTGPFAVPTFQKLLASDDRVVALITRPERPARGRSSAAPSLIRQVATDSGLPVLDPEDVNAASFAGELASLAADLFVVCDYGQILSPAVLRLAALGGINLHGSLLPKYRGAAPVNWAIYHGEQRTGITVIHMTPGLDAGPCLTSIATDISDHETAGELEDRLAQLGVSAVSDAIEMLRAWDGRSALGVTQDASLVTTARRLRKSDGQVDWRRTAVEIWRQTRALQPWPGTFTEFVDSKGRRLRLILTMVTPVDADPAAEGFTPGQVARADGEHLWIATGDGWLSIDRLQPAGKRVMEVAEFLRGHHSLFNVGRSLAAGPGPCDLGRG